MKTYKHTCSICNTEIEYQSYKSYWTAKSRNGMCKSCRSTIANKSSKRNTKRENNSQWKGYRDIPYGWFSRYFERANITKRTGDITIQQVYDLWVVQDKKCALSGVTIGFYDDGKNHTCSIDRIDSLKEYTIDNIQLVHKDINIMKNKFDNQYFINMCKNINQWHSIEKNQ